MRIRWASDSCEQREYIGLVGDRWQSREIPHWRTVLLEEVPLPFHYLPGAME
jgi:hypothetical protein